MAPIEMSLNDRPVARKVGEIFVRSGKEDRRRLKDRRRTGYNDDDQ